MPSSLDPGSRYAPSGCGSLLQPELQPRVLHDLAVELELRAVEGVELLRQSSRPPRCRPSAACSTTPGSFIARAISADSFSMIGFGVAAGA